MLNQTAIPKGRTTGRVRRMNPVVIFVGVLAWAHRS